METLTILSAVLQPAEPYRPSDFIRYCTVDGRVVILDLRIGEYVTLDAIASEMWNLVLLHSDCHRCVEELAARFSVTKSQCGGDLAAFLVSCRERGMLRVGAIDSPVTKTPLSYRPPVFLTAWRCLFETRRQLARRGFPAVYDAQRRMTKALAIQQTPNAMVHALRTFRRAENLFPTDDTGINCLPRSLALHRFLLRVGIDADHCIGVRRFPFGAHAWVESGSSVICDSPSFVDQFMEISRI